MGLIKANTPPAARASAFSMADIEKQARNILVRARQQADQVLAEAQREGEELREQARMQGARAGYSEGLARGRSEGAAAGQEQALGEHREHLTALVAALTAAAEELNASRMALEAGVVREVVDLAVKIAERVAKRLGVIYPEVLAGNVGEALKLVVGMHKLRIAIHPTQRATLGEALPQLKLEFPTLDHVELVEDPSVAPGGCRLLTRQGSVDATLDEQISRIATELVPGRVERMEGHG
jgi:flagellar assembly protein FliH